ncbi:MULTISPECIES: hypothetical protein [unclassified Clostridium]|uniref:hypothetical protein n=1 Tax=unclassified Clostridium TaxID=2614128 RepID=UPI0011067C3A|nr:MULTISPECIES: hypothetical protein [unclassified Clostridium]
MDRREYLTDPWDEEARAISPYLAGRYIRLRQRAMRGALPCAGAAVASRTVHVLLLRPATALPALRATHTALDAVIVLMLVGLLLDAGGALEAVGLGLGVLVAAGAAHLPYWLMMLAGFGAALFYGAYRQSPVAVFLYLCTSLIVLAKSPLPGPGALACGALLAAGMYFIAEKRRKGHDL